MEIRRATAPFLFLALGLGLITTAPFLLLILLMATSGKSVYFKHPGGIRAMPFRRLQRCNRRLRGSTSRRSGVQADKGSGGL